MEKKIKAIQLTKDGGDLYLTIHMKRKGDLLNKRRTTTVKKLQFKIPYYGRNIETIYSEIKKLIQDSSSMYYKINLEEPKNFDSKLIDSQVGVRKELHYLMGLSRDVDNFDGLKVIKTEDELFEVLANNYNVLMNYSNNSIISNKVLQSTNDKDLVILTKPSRYNMVNIEKYLNYGIIYRHTSIIYTYSNEYGTIRAEYLVKLADKQIRDTVRNYKKTYGIPETRMDD